MSENFNKLKKFFIRYTAIKCAVFGISLGLFAAGIVLLALKLSAVSISPAYYVLIGAGTAGIAGTALFFIFRPVDKKLAKRLDIEYGLNEKVQTMLAYEGSQSDLAVIQRETTDSRLGTIKARLRLSEILKQVVAPVLACAMLTTAIAIPAKQAQAVVVDPPYDFGEDQFASLKQLIKDVKDSRMESGLKTSVASVLQGLLESIDREEGDELTNSQMTATVLSAVAVIDALIAQANSYIVIGSELKKSENLEDLGNAVLIGVVSYRDSTRLRTLARVNEKSEKSEETINSALNGSVEKINALFSEVYGEDMRNAINGFSEIFEGLLENTGYAEKDDGLYNALETMCASIKKVASEVPQLGEQGWSPSALRGMISSACSKFVEDGTEILVAQSYNCMMDEFIRECLSAIFGIALADFPSNKNVIYTDNSQSGNPSEPPDDNKIHDGGHGGENTLYGGDEVIFYPGDVSYVKYGKVLNEYYKAVVDHLDSNNVPEEYRQFIQNYFDILHKGLEEQKN